MRTESREKTSKDEDIDVLFVCGAPRWGIATTLSQRSRRKSQAVNLHHDRHAAKAAFLPLAGFSGRDSSIGRKARESLVAMRHVTPLLDRSALLTEPRSSEVDLGSVMNDLQSRDFFEP